MTIVSFGDTVSAAQLWESLETTLWAAKLAGRPVVFSIDGGAPISRSDAEVWVTESAQLGYTQIRYAAASCSDGRVLVDLAAVRIMPG
jgi:hypothetical protein